MSFAIKLGDEYGKKLMDTATKAGINAAKTASKRIVQKTVEAAEDLIGNKIADKISVCKTKSKEKEDKRQEIYIPLDATSDNVPRFITKKWIDVHDQSGSAEDRYKPSKQMRFKTSILRLDLCDYCDVYIVLKEDISLTGAANKFYWWRKQVFSI